MACWKERGKKKEEKKRKGKKGEKARRAPSAGVKEESGEEGARERENERREIWFVALCSLFP